MTPNTGDGIGIAVWRREKRKRGRESKRSGREISRIIEKKTKKEINKLRIQMLGHHSIEIVSII